MAKKDDSIKISAEVDVNDLGVLGRHHARMANDQDYRDRALTPPGGKAPGEDGKPESPLPEGHGVPDATLVAAAQ